MGLVVSWEGFCALDGISVVEQVDEDLGFSCFFGQVMGEMRGRLSSPFPPFLLKTGSPFHPPKKWELVSVGEKEMMMKITGSQWVERSMRKAGSNISEWKIQLVRDINVKKARNNRVVSFFFYHYSVIWGERPFCTTYKVWDHCLVTFVYLKIINYWDSCVYICVYIYITYKNKYFYCCKNICSIK